METTLFATGIACLIAAIIGGGLKAFGIEIPLLKSIPRQVALGAFGAVLLALSFVKTPTPDSEPVSPRSDIEQEKESSVVFDLTHGQGSWYYLEDSMRRLLPNDALFIKEGDLLSHSKIIDRAQVLLLALPYHQNFSLDEINYVRDWVADGGGLLLMGYYSAERHHENNICEMTRVFGFEFTDNLLMPPGKLYPDTRTQRSSQSPDLGVKIAVTSEAGYEILNDVRKTVFVSSSTIVNLTGKKPYFALSDPMANEVWIPQYDTSPGGMPSAIVKYTKTDPSELPLLLAVEHGRGRVVLIGTWKLATVDYGDNTKLMGNLILWLRQKKYQD